MMEALISKILALLTGRRCDAVGNVVSYSHADPVDHITHDQRNYRGGVHPFSAGREQAVADLGCVRVLAQELSAELLRTVQHGERAPVREATAALIAAAKRCGLYIPYSDRVRFGDLKRRRTGEREVYVGSDDSFLVKFKDPDAKQPIKNTSISDWLYEHVLHNILFPETRYEFMGVSEVVGTARLVLRQKNVTAVSFPSDQMVADELGRIGLSGEDRYCFGNNVLSVTDVGAQSDNVLLDNDGHMYFIDPLIKLKCPAKEALTWLVGEI